MDPFGIFYVGKTRLLMQSETETDISDAAAAAQPVATFYNDQVQPRTVKSS